MAKRNGLGKGILISALTAAMIFTGIPVYASPVRQVSGKQEEKILLQEKETVTSIDFTEMENLDFLPEGWVLTNGSGSSGLVEDEGGKALKMTRSQDGGEVSLANSSLNIQESEYRYVTIDTRIKVSSEEYANQFSMPYIQNENGATVYTLFTNDDWTQYKSHVTDKNHVLEAGTLTKDQWQDVRMDIDMETDTFRVSVDGEYVLAGVNAREKTDNLQTIKYYADSWNRGTIYLQSVKVTAEKERTESATFYVSNSGDDSADGQSPETAWQTLDRVNAEYFIPGDKILFECGGKWENQTLQPQGSGSEDAMITIGNYGEGELPQIAANGKMKDALYLCNQQYWEISGLDISNTVEGFTMVSNGGIPTGNVTEHQEDQGELLGEYRGIHIAGRDVASLKGFHIHDLKVHDVTGVVSWIGDTGLDDAGIVNNAGLDGSKRTGGILIECLSPTGDQATQFSDIVIEDNSFINSSFGAVTVKQWNGSGNQYSENPGWANRNNSSYTAPDYEDDNWKPHSNIIIQNNYINQGASAYACNGIYLTSSRDSLIQRNVLENIGTCGIELYFTDNVAVQYNEVSNVVKKCGGADDNAIDPDWRATNALIQYNYIHDCGEGILLCGVQYNSGIVRYNLIQDCGRSYVHYSMGSGYFQIYNNVFYLSADGNGTNNFDPWGSGKASYFNNVFYDGKGEGFVFSSSTSFSYYNNAYYGTSAPGKDSNPILLTEDPFEGSAPSMDRKGTAESGVLLEANGLRPTVVSPLIAAGVSEDANGISIDEGLKSKGAYFNFTSLDVADTNYLGDCIYISRTDYPTFEKTGTEATFDTAKTQTAADKDTPTIGMFEVPLDEDAVILRGTVSDGINPLANAYVEIKVDDVTVNTTTGDSGTYSVTEGLKAGEATITVRTEGREDVSITVQLEAGKVNVGDVRVPLVPMADEYEYEIFNETFVDGSSENFSFDQGSEITDGALVITKDMGNAAAAVSYFSPEITTQKGVDFSFDYKADSADKMGLEFRDSYGRLLFAVCAAPQKTKLRTSTTGDAVDDDKAASASEPVWSAVEMSTDKTYTFRVHADFEVKTVSFQLKEKDGDVLAQQLNIPTDAVNLAKMNACSWWDSEAQYIDNFRLTAPEKEVDLPLEGKTIYAFGDSIVAGHQYQKAGFAEFVAAAEGMEIQNFAVNGATVMDADYEGGQIAAQVEVAPSGSPDFVLFSGGTNDAEYIADSTDVQYGEVTDSVDPDSFDTATFAGAFESLVYQMRQKYPDAQLVYTAVHKMVSRDKEVQEKLRAVELAVCEKYGVAVADVYGGTDLDTNDVNKKNGYTFDSLAANGLPGNNGSGTHPNFKAIEEFYVPVVTATLRDPASSIPDTEEPVDKQALEAKLSEAKAAAEKTDIYTAESLAALNDAIKAAQAVLDDPTAEQSALDEQTDLVNVAVQKLVKQEAPSADKSALEAKLDEAKAKTQQTDVYTEDSLAALNTAIQEAEKVLNDETVSQEDIDAQVSSLQSAIDGLKKADSGKPDNPSGNHNNDGDSEKADKSDVPKTGDDTNIVIPAITGGATLILILVAVMEIYRKKRR